MTTQAEGGRQRARPRGLLTEIARAIGWLALDAGVSKLPEVHTVQAVANPRDVAKRTVAAKENVTLPLLVRAAASLVGVVLAFFPRRHPELQPGS